MPIFETRNFGRVEYEAGAALEFPQGLPAFEQCRRFLALTLPQSEPVIFLQSLEDAGLCFLTVPIRVVDQNYELRMTGEDRELIGLARDVVPRIGEQVLCLAVLSVRKEGPTANLLAPIVVNLSTRCAVQAVDSEAAYPHQHPLMPACAAEGEVKPEACMV